MNLSAMNKAMGGGWMSERLSRERLAEIASRAEAATEGPWAKYGIGGVTSPDWDIAWEGHGYCQNCGGEVSQQPFVNPADADFCAHARQDIPALLAHIAALEAENERLRAVVDAALLMRSACPMDWTHGDCRDSQCAVVCCALAALDKEVGE